MGTSYMQRALAALEEAVRSDTILNIGNFINGKFVDFDATAGCVPSINPSNGEEWARMPNSNEVDVNHAVESAEQAFHADWVCTTYGQRAAYLNRIADIVEKHAAQFALYESMDQGKTVATASQVDIPRCVHNFRFFASSIMHVTEDSTTMLTPDGRTALNYVHRRPLGVAALIVPWNLPLYLLSFKLAPALAAGNTVVVKPSEMTSVTAWLLAHAIMDAGVPHGVVNFVFGTGPSAGEPLIKHALTKIVSFTGSTVIGRHIAMLTCKTSKKVSLEMGGKNPCIVFDDADLDLAIPIIVRSCFANQGEICLASSRLFIHADIFEQFMFQFVSAAKQFKTGHPSMATSMMGALVSSQHYEKVLKYIKIAHDDDDVAVHCGGMDGIKQLMNDETLAHGYYVPPTIVSGQAATSPLMTEEIFGPVVCVSQFTNVDAVIGWANDTEYGLSASIWSTDVNTVHKTAQRLHAGTVWCNCWLVRDLNMPFGGQKASGVGRESAKDSLEFFTERSTICVAL